MTNSCQTKYFNFFGLVFDNAFYFHNGNKMSKIPLSFVKSVKIFKGRELKINLFLLLISTVLILFYFFFNNNNNTFQSDCIATTIITPLLLTSFLYKKYFYEIVLVTKDYNPILLNVSIEFRNDAEQIVSQISKKITEDNNEKIAS